MDPTNAAIILPIRRPGLIAVCQRLPGIRLAGYTATPGGGIDEGEDPFVAALRELEEEGGLKVPTWRLRYIGRHTALASDGMMAGGFFFILEMQPGEQLRDMETDKHTAWQEIPFAQAASRNLFPPLDGLILTLAAGAACTEAA
jgi:8-oxo-dGTP pyrophosphatase MutT (NUDIX family)